MFNKFGNIFTFTSWGESHGPAIGCVVDGVPAQIPLSESDIQPYLDKRRPAQSKYTTQRKETDQVEILSGVFEGQTTGHPISLLIRNVDAKSKDYSEIKDRYRPGHADYSYDQKYGIRDYRGGGRSSARETAMRVAAGAIARKILGTDVTIRAAMVQMGEHTIQRDQWDWQQVQANPFFSPDASSVPLWEDYLTTIRKEGSSVGAVIEVVAEGIPVGLGEPTYKKLDAEIAAALMGIHAVKGVEIGDGFTAATLRGEENADAMRMEGNEVTFTSNHAGGVMGGISTGQPIVARFAVKPTSSLLIPVDSVTQDGREVQVQTKGRHDPCVGIRAVPVGEAMMACVLADHLLMHRARKA
jgi:chorismate synthase